MKQVHIIHNIYESDKKTVAEVDNVTAYLMWTFEEFPEFARIYAGEWAKSCDITEKLRKDHNYAESLDCDIYVVVYPALTPFEIFAIVSAVFSVGLSLYTMLTMPKMSTQAQQSPNNELQNRQNSARLGGRVPEIFGQVRAFPDLIAETYTYYNTEGIKVERSLLCMSKGFFQINEVRDADTKVDELSGTSISIYDPSTSIIGTPIFRTGRVFNDLPKAVRKSKSITGQAFDYPDGNRFDGNNLYFTSDGKIKAKDSTNLNLFDVGDKIRITGAVFESPAALYSGSMDFDPANKIIIETSIDVANFADYKGLILTGALVSIPDPLTSELVPFDFSGQYDVDNIVRTDLGGYYRYEVELVSPNTVNPSWNMLINVTSGAAGAQLNRNTNSTNLDGTYSVESISATQIVLSAPELVNPDWLNIASMTGGTTQGYTVNVALDEISDKWIGWFNLELDDAENLVVNVRFPQGLYRQNSKGGTSNDYTELAYEYQNVVDGVPVGAVTRVDKRYDGETRVAFGVTEEFPVTSGSIRFRMCRTRATISTNVVAEALAEDVYLARTEPKSIYPDVTVIQSEAIANDGVLSIKERKLNILGTRRLPINGTGALAVTKSAAQALIYLALDNKNGRRTINEVDVTQIIGEQQKVLNYFNDAKSTEFSYTFDDNNLSFEEMAGMITSTVFCEAYRFGSKLRMKFEQPQSSAVILFSCKNKTIGSEKRTKSFGVKNRYDGVDIEYTSPENDTRINYVASDIVNPSNLMTIKTSGIRTHEQAKTRAWREWNKLKYQSITTEFEGGEESNLVVRNDRILSSNCTVIKVNDGEVESQNGLTLHLSNEISDLTSNYIYLQMTDATIDGISCTVVNNYTVQLSRLPLLPLVPYKTTYQLDSSSVSNANAFLVTEIRPQSKISNILTCVNYDSRYYAKDHDFFAEFSAPYDLTAVYKDD